MAQQKRVMAIHDISGFGRCSLTVALPIISAAGIETVALPTAVLSTHTGGIPGFTYHDLTSDIAPVANHWHDLGLQFDAIYTGFLGSFEQINLVMHIIDQFKTQNNLIMIDPVMADHGELYKSFSPEFPKEMLRLCAKADILVPNITEACLLIDEPYQEGPYTEEYIQSILEKLAKIGPKKIVLTGVHFDNEQLGAAAYDAVSHTTQYAFSSRVQGQYHGTGDVFGSALLSALLLDFPLQQAAQLAVDFTHDSIERTQKAGTDIRFGVNFEACIPRFIKQLKLI